MESAPVEQPDNDLQNSIDQVDRLEEEVLGLDLVLFTVKDFVWLLEIQKQFRNNPRPTLKMCEEYIEYLTSLLHQLRTKPKTW